MYFLYKFKTRGIGVVSEESIEDNIYIADYMSKNEEWTQDSRLVYDGWKETNPFGRFMNHNRNPNCRLEKDGDLIKLISIKPIQKNEELTVNYMEVIKLIEIPKELAKEYNIIDFDYKEEKIN